MCIKDPIQPRTGGLFGSSLEDRENERKRERENRRDGISGRESRIESLLVGPLVLSLFVVYCPKSFSVPY